MHPTRTRRPRRKADAGARSGQIRMFRSDLSLSARGGHPMRLVAILALAGAVNLGPAFAQQGGMMQGGQGAMMGQREMANLKELAPERAVQAVTDCKGRYLVSTAAGAQPERYAGQRPGRGRGL